jgi:excisionase family DNA binding protein
MSAHHLRGGRDPAPADLDQATPPAARSPAATKPGRPEPGRSAERLAYSIDEAARLTGLSRDLLYDEMRRGHLTYVKVGRRRLITRHHLQEFLGDASS